MIRCDQHGLLNCALCSGQPRFIPQVEKPTWNRPTTSRASDNHYWTDAELDALMQCQYLASEARRARLSALADAAGVSYGSAYSRYMRATGQADHWSHGQVGGLA